MKLIINGNVMTKKLIGILIMMQCALGQQTQGGIPYSKIYNLGSNIHIINLPSIDHDALLTEDMYKELGTPYRYGYKHEVHYTPENSGIWEKTVDGGMIWQIRFISEGAYSISVEYEVFFYSKRRSIIYNDT